MGDIKICSRCIMDETAKEITFDEKGICNFCHHYDNVLVNEIFSNKGGEEKIEKLIEEIKEKGKNSKYDCLIGLSGGVDSSYVAYLVRKKYGLRVYAVHLDNGWNTELAVANVEQIVKRLGIDLNTYVLDWKEFRDIQLSFLKSSISNIEIPTDHAIWALLIKTAAKMKIPYIIAGNNVVTESIMPESWLYGSKDSRLIKSIHKRFGKVKMKTFPSLSTLDYIDYLLLRGIRWVPILNYVNYNKAEAKELLIKELGWRDYGGKHYESIFTRFFHAYYLPEKFGYDLRKSYLSALVCSGQITRQEALEEISKPPAPKEILESDRDYVIKKFGLTIEQFETILRSPNKTYQDYPNNDKLWKRFNKFIKIARKRITRVQ
ncbi:N-acetyl sugar amidotransferase [Cecembia rubra]|uniref:N-acetyl sugar amidotransferase n=1 Tax=Cecembia rubra TaxID=1485585 RepID=A0A2P8EA22_9BACT|nr:N-acetyl sugar amidotransferase [Cecembia rubra]PSL06321.1 N-acetyl sugar amidotransferase [Cecembia rubra]